MQGDTYVRERRRQQGRADRQLRLVAIGCLLGIAVTHLIDIGHKFEEAPAIATMFVALVVAANGLALLFVVAKRLDGAWKLALHVAVAPFVAAGSRSAGSCSARASTPTPGTAAAIRAATGTAAAARGTRAAATTTRA